VKLNGSPLHAIPDTLGATIDLVREADHQAADYYHEEVSKKTETRLEHAIALGDYDFLQITRLTQWSFDRDQSSRKPDVEPSEDGMPDWLVNQIHEPHRYWMLLGHRFADWNSRAQLHTFLAHTSGPIERGCAVAREFDNDRIRFLDWLKITRARGDAADLIEPLRQLASRISSGRGTTP
jgi:hypothetical protein